eukprot:355369-Chlamydomonas_euryale.AAC.13
MHVQNLVAGSRWEHVHRVCRLAGDCNCNDNAACFTHVVLLVELAGKEVHIGGLRHCEPESPPPPRWPGCPQHSRGLVARRRPLPAGGRELRFSAQSGVVAVT